MKRTHFMLGGGHRFRDKPVLTFTTFRGDTDQ